MRLLGVGVDRLDYTKGVEERLLAVELCWSGIRSFAAVSVSPNWRRRAGRKSTLPAI